MIPPRPTSSREFPEVFPLGRPPGNRTPASVPAVPGRADGTPGTLRRLKDSRRGSGRRFCAGQPRNTSQQSSQYQRNCRDLIEPGTKRVKL